MPADFLARNLDIIFGVYGLAFFLLGIAILIQERRESSYKLSSNLWLLAGFGLSHGLNEWLDMFAIQRGFHSEIYALIQLIMLTVSFIFLFEFGRRLLRLSLPKFMSIWATPVFSLFVVVLIVFSKQEASLWPRYFLCFPGACLSGVGLILYYHSEADLLKPQKVYRFFLIAAITFFVYGILGGLVTLPASFFPASVINTTSFMGLFGIPVQLFRAGCAVSLAWSVWKILGIFNWENRLKLKKSLDEITDSKLHLEMAFQKLRETQDALVQTEKLAVVGLLAAGVAHEINNPLSVISMEAEMMRKDLDKDENTRETSELIVEQSKRIKNIINRLSAFAKKEYRADPLNINKDLDESISLVSYQTRQGNIKIITELGADLPLVFGDNKQLQEVFLNLLLNAVQAMEKGGALTIRTSCQKTTKREKEKNNLFKQAEKMAVIEFADTGKGMDEQTIKQIFAPFFSTKETGTGLGLFVCYRIIEDHNGLIEVQSKLGKGSVFTVKLPERKGVR